MEICYNSEKMKDTMKDKIFVTFLCVAVFCVTNAMGDAVVGVGTCVVQEGTKSAGAVEYRKSGDGSVWLDGEFMFVSDNKALQCGGENCVNGAGFKIIAENYGFRCTVTDGTGEWQKVELGDDIPFCEDSKINVLEVENAEYYVITNGQIADKFYGEDYAISIKGFCVKSDCEENYDFVDQKCQPKGQSAKGSGNGDTVSTDDNDIETLGKWLDAETEKFERSEWRDAEGKFNTARLASDSIAGVVLGTAGGLISSKVIKKKQVENGFEDIKCTIGSQEVADWGDEFQVGIQ